MEKFITTVGWSKGVVAFLLLFVAGPLAALEKNLESLSELLQSDDHYRVRVQAAKAMGLMGDQKAVPYLIRGLSKDKNRMVRGTCAWALGALDHPGSVDVLAKATKKGHSFVRKQAGKARRKISENFPGNIPGFRQTKFHISLRKINDKVTKGEDLVRFLQDSLATRLVRYDNFDFGQVMDIEDEDYDLDTPAAFAPIIYLSIEGNIDRMDEPRGRKPGPVKLEAKLKLTWVDGKKKLVGTRYVGSAEFDGGPKPDNELDDDPLVEARKDALLQIAKKSCQDFISILKNGNRGTR